VRTLTEDTVKAGLVFRDFDRGPVVSRRSADQAADQRRLACALPAAAYDDDGHVISSVQ